MDRLQKIQRVSAVLRYLLIAAATAIGVAVIIAMFSPGQGWVTVGQGRFFELWNSEASSRMTLIAIMLPTVTILCLGVYWLQRLFGEYQAGQFFTDSSMRCYIWLVWLKATNFLYGAVWPQLLASMSTSEGAIEPAINIQVSTLIETIVLLLVVYLLKEAQQINDENKAFV
jgi:hypothetical protein